MSSPSRSPSSRLAKSEVIWSVALVLGVLGIAAYAGASERAPAPSRGIASLGAPALRDMPDPTFHLLPENMRNLPGSRGGMEFRGAYRGPMQASHVAGGYLIQQNGPQSPAGR